MKKIFHTYILTNHSNTVLYTGSSSNLKERIYKHKQGFYINSFTKKYKLYKLVWFQEFSTALEMISAEQKIKGWKRKKKIDLIKSINPDFKDLML